MKISNLLVIQRINVKTFSKTYTLRTILAFLIYSNLETNKLLTISIIRNYYLKTKLLFIKTNNFLHFLHKWSRKKIDINKTKNRAVTLKNKIPLNKPKNSVKTMDLISNVFMLRLIDRK